MYASQFRKNDERRIGKKAQATATKFQEALLLALDKHAWSDISITTVARLAGYAPATVYQYFSTLNDLALTTAERLAANDQPIPQHLTLVMNLLMFETHEGLFTPADISVFPA